MDHEMTDRRLQRRYPGASLRLLQSTLRPGCDVEVLDLSESGAQIQTDRPLGPGLRVRGGKACIDATIEGLVAARERIAAELLAEIDHRLAGSRTVEVTT